MRPKSLYHALGMDKNTYSDVPKMKHVPAKQGEHYYVHIDGRDQQDSMLKVLEMPSVRYSNGVYGMVKSQKSSIIRVNIEEKFDDRTKMKVMMSSRAIVKANDSRTITLSQFLGRIT